MVGMLCGCASAVSGCSGQDEWEKTIMAYTLYDLRTSHDRSYATTDFWSSTHQCAGPPRVIRKDTHNLTNDKRWIVDQATL